MNAPVDAGVAQLVEALSAFPGLETRESCEGGDTNPAWVSFAYGAYWDNPWRDLAEFVLGFLGPALAEQLGDRAYLAIHVAETGIPYGDLNVRPGAMDRTVQVLRDIANNARAE